MPGDRRLLPGDEGLPADLAAVLVLVLAGAGSVVVPVVRDSPVRVVLGLALVLLLPGYAVVAALFPEQGPTRSGTGDDGPDKSGAGPDKSGAGPDASENGPPERGGDGTPSETATDRLFGGDGIDGTERVALSVGLSIAVVPLVGLVLAATPWGLRTGPVVATLCGLTVAATAGAARRRRALPARHRFTVPYREWYEAARDGFSAPDSLGDRALNALLAVTVVVAAASVGYAVAVPRPSEQFTELYVLAENESGRLVADEYPTEFVRGEPRSLVVGVDNHEGRSVDYTLVVVLQQVDDAGRVVSEREVSRFHPSLASNETWLAPHEIAPRTTGTRQRVVYLLYESSPPAEPSVENAYRSLHLWITVSASADNSSVAPPASRGPDTGR